jgi:hypothetical protein
MALRNRFSSTAGEGHHGAGQGKKAAGAKEKQQSRSKSPELKLPEDTQLSLACALNLLFLLKGEWGSIGDYVTSFKVT